MKFNKDYNPDWNTEIYGEPDVIAMCRAVRNVDELLALRENNQMLIYSEIKNSLPKFDDYVKMLETRNKIFESLHSKNLSYEQACDFIQTQIKQSGE